jgi:pyruvate formate lyase activating enzyme
VVAEQQITDVASGLVFNVQRFSIHDGPGIRTTVFLKGCPLECWWCHNPEGLHRDKEVSYRTDRCIVCGECVDACPHGALSKDERRIQRDPLQCVVCGTCLDSCATGARDIVGQELSVGDVMTQIARDRVFFETSGGGVTFSGGEPLFQIAFLSSLLRECKKQSIHTAVETSGYATPASFERIAETTDLFLFDVKLMDDERHQRFTGVSNRIILDNLRHLAGQQQNVIVRIPVIGGVNDDQWNIDAIAAFVSELPGIRHIHLLPFHSAAAGKYQSLGMNYRMDNGAHAGPDRMQQIVETFSTQGFSVQIGG